MPNQLFLALTTTGGGGAARGSDGGGKGVRGFRVPQIELITEVMMLFLHCTASPKTHPQPVKELR